jgi:hypothetical protein
MLYILNKFHSPKFAASNRQKKSLKQYFTEEATEECHG